MALLAVAASQAFASTRPILGDDGKPLPGSIAVMEKVNLNGSEQWITIRGKDATKPVLLYLGIGGPGAGGFPATRMNLAPLEDHFVVVNWDQPGTGKSYNAAPISTLTVQRFVDDARALTDLLIVYAQLYDLDFTQQAAKLEAPVYFLVGKKDVNAVAALVERYYAVLQAPHKELVWLDSAHGAGGARVRGCDGELRPRPLATDEVKCRASICFCGPRVGLLPTLLPTFEGAAGGRGVRSQCANRSPSRRRPLG